MNADYLKESVGKYLCRALCEVAKRRPDRPIEFLAYYLISLYEKDLELQREEKKAEQQEEEELTDDHMIAPVISQMFRERLSISMSRDSLNVSPTLTGSSAAVDRDTEDATPEDEIGFTPHAPEVETEDEIYPDHDVSDTDKDEEKPTGVDSFVLQDRKFSTVDNPVTEEEEKMFGTSDPFLARRASKVFDVTAAPIGNQ